MGKALLIVDIQNDFLQEGTLPVPNAEEIIPFVNQKLEEPFDIVIASKDWHPQGHVSFASTHGKKVGEKVTIDNFTQILWPDHCLQESVGSEIHPGVKAEKIQRYLLKGSSPEIDSYSAFFNEHKLSTGLHATMQEHNIQEIHLLGLATEYCVLYTGLDALALGYRLFVYNEGCRGIKEDDTKKALELLKQKGAIII